MGGAKRLPSQLPGSQLTLAQRVGLIPKPDKLLTPEEWLLIHGLARQRRDPFTACAICLEVFKAEQQVLLSCSHVFHAQCLTSFEAHVRLKACPLCRKQSYQKHLISDAADAFRHVCATRIQAAVRGWLCRKTLPLTMQTPPRGCSLKRTWISARLQETRNALTGQVQDAAEDLDVLFAEIDASLEVSRQLGDPCQARQAAVQMTSKGCMKLSRPGMLQQQQQQQQQWPQPGRPRMYQHSTCTAAAACRRTTGNSTSRGQPANPAGVNKSSSSNSRNGGSSSIMPASGRSLVQHDNTPQAAAVTARAEPFHRPLASRDTAADLLDTNSSSTSNTAASVDWEQVVSKACDRCETECAICLGSLQGQRQTQGVALLSCSHIFHMSCVTSFEQFEQGRGGQGSCPVCRSAYTRRCFDVQAVQ